MKMKMFLCAAALALLAGAMAGAADEIYVKMHEAAPVILSNGQEITTGTADCYPFEGYDGTQALMQLKLGDLSFWTRKENGEITPAAGAAEAAANYHALAAKFQPKAAKNIAEGVVKELGNPLRAIVRQELRKVLTAKEGDHVEAFPVDADGDTWQNSGVRVKAGQHVLVQAAPEEKWNIGWGPIDAKGYKYPQDPNARMPIFHVGRQNQDWHWGALVCAVGGGRFELSDPEHQTEIGLKRGFSVDKDGYIYFACNRNPGDSNGDNGISGIIHVNVTITDTADDSGAQAEDAKPADSVPMGGETAGTIARQLEDPLRTLLGQEFSKALAGKNGVPDSGSFPVDSTNGAWQNSGVHVKAGQQVLVQANEEDQWNISWGPTDANGYGYRQNSFGSDLPTFHTGRQFIDWHWGALIGAVGANQAEIKDPQHQFEVGTKRAFTADEDGYIYFICNDSRYDDNTGIIHVKVTVKDAPADSHIKADDAPTPAGPTESPPAKREAPPAMDEAH